MRWSYNAVRIKAEFGIKSLEEHSGKIQAGKLIFMSHSIFVFLFLIDPSEVPSPLSSWHDAAGLISDRWNRFEQKRDAEGFLASSSRNWWHQHLLYLVCQAHNIKGLEFATREIACLGQEDLQAAENSLGELFGLVRTHRLHEKLAKREAYADILGPNYLAAFDRAQKASKVEQSDDGFDGAVSFFAFLKSLRSIIQYAHQENKSLLFVMPDFQYVVGSFDSGPG